MYHISNYGFADPNYMEHYGIKGMRWRKRRRHQGENYDHYDYDHHDKRKETSSIRNPLTTDRGEYSKNRKNRSRPGMYNESGSIKGSRKVGGSEQGHNPEGLMSVRRAYQNLYSLRDLGSVKSLSNNKVDDLKNKLRPLDEVGLLKGINPDPLDINRRRRRR
jgi:hypothetical protein